MNRAPKQPPANTSVAALHVRTAAIAFGKLLDKECNIGDPYDRAGQAANRKLLKAALAYAEEVIKQQGHPLLDALKDVRSYLRGSDRLDLWAEACDSALSAIHKYDPDWKVS